MTNVQNNVAQPHIVITTLTLLSFVSGIISYFNIMISFLLLIPVLMYPFYKQINHLTPIHIGYCTISMYIMGIVDMYAFMNFSVFSIFIWMITVRYYAQFQMNNIYHHSELYWSSNHVFYQGFTIYHSKSYFVGNVFILLEHFITKHYFHFEYKYDHILMVPSFVICFSSLIIRILAFFTAKKNFTHKISRKKKQTHVLITHGVYKYLRHPSYTGFFYYTIFSLIMIGNFASAIILLIVMVKFFRARLEDEEYYLFQFFGERYRNYYQKTYTLIPFLYKYKMNEQ